MNKESYDNFITSFKKKMWDICSEENIFRDLNNSDFEKVKSIFETNIENYKSHILQTNGDDKIIKTLITNIKNEVENIKNNIQTREDISNMRKEQFENEYQKKQNEFNTLLKNDAPENLDFSDNSQDKPLEAENLEALIQEQLKDRKLNIPVPNESNDSNVIVSSNQYTESIKTPETSTNIQPKESFNINDNFPQPSLNNNSEINELIIQNKTLISEILLLKQQLNSQNGAIHKILTSQVVILKKLK